MDYQRLLDARGSGEQTIKPIPRQFGMTYAVARDVLARQRAEEDWQRLADHLGMPRPVDMDGLAAVIYAHIGSPPGRKQWVQCPECYGAVAPETLPDGWWMCDHCGTEYRHPDDARRARKAREKARARRRYRQAHRGRK